MAKNQKNELMKKWEHEITKIAKEMGELLKSKDIFVKTRDIVVSKGYPIDGSLFFNWIADIYVTRLSVGIRRISDTHRGTLSLTNLIRNITKNQNVLTRSVFCSSWPDFTQDSGEPNEIFNRFADEDSEELNTDWLQEDVDRINIETNKIKNFIDKWVVHHDLVREQSKVPTFGDVYSVLQFLDGLICKYHLLLAGSDLSGTCKPVYNQNWTNVLKQAWIEKE